MYGAEYITVLEHVLDSESEVLVAELEAAFGSGTVEDIKDVGSAADQLHRILQTLTTGESEDLVLESPKWFDSLRRLRRRGIRGPQGERGICLEQSSGTLSGARSSS